MTDPSRPGVRLRPTAIGDIAMVQAWERDPASAAFVQVWSGGRHREALVDPTQRHLVLEAGGRAVGFVLLAGIEGTAPIIEFRRIVVAQKGRGIGQAAVAAVLSFAFERLEAGEVWLDFVEHNDRARHIYEKHGFRVDPSAELWTEIAGERTRLVKMTLTREGFERLDIDR